MRFGNGLFASVIGALRHITVFDIIDILICAVLIFLLITWTRKTRAWEVVKGIIYLVIFRVFAGVLQLNAIGWFIDSFLSTGSIIIIIVVLFQPEVRRVLERLGHTGKQINAYMNGDNGEKLVQDVARSIQAMARRRVGALIVFEQKTALGDIIATGTTIDGYLSGALLENIFEPNTPLHDGAVIVRGNRVVAAATFLPLSDDPTILNTLGTRHRAGIGVSTVSDCVSIIVSEETGTISFASDGKLTRYVDDKALRDKLTSLLVKEQVKYPMLIEWVRRRFVK